MSSVKYQVCRLIRMLVHICKTLDSMPAEVCDTACGISFNSQHAMLLAYVAGSVAIPPQNIQIISWLCAFMGRFVCVTEDAADAAEVPVHEADVP